MRRSPHLVRHADLAHALWGEAGGDIATLHTHLSVLRSVIDRPSNSSCCTPFMASAIAWQSPQMPRLGLRTRVAALCALLGLVVSACLSLAPCTSPIPMCTG